MAANQKLSQQSQHCNFIPIAPQRGVVTLFGYGITAHVNRGHLILSDGIGATRREARLARVRHGLKRLVVIGSSGTISFSALQWLTDAGAAFVLLERDGSLLSSVGPVHPSDCRLRRAQATASQTSVALRVSRELIRAKLSGQERIARDKLRNLAAAETINHFRSALDTATTIPTIRVLEARAASAYWHCWRDLPVNFPNADLRRVPEHWRTFGTRISPVSGSPRCAVSPPNSVLNFLYSLVESEARLALTAVGLDPGLGFLHVDSRTRDSAACDLMEAVRPNVDAYVLDWLTHRMFQRKDFFEMTDGTCRLMSDLCVQLSQTAQAWRDAIAPWAELVARTLWATIPKTGNHSRPATPLTGDHRRAGRIGTHVRRVALPPEPSRLCKICGVACKKIYCASCGAAHARDEFDKGRIAAQAPTSLAQRSATQKAHALANRAWKPSKEFAWLDRKAYIDKIQPQLSGIAIPVLQSALGISEPYASFIRSGSRIPHPRHWTKLAELLGISQ